MDAPDRPTTTGHDEEEGTTPEVPTPATFERESPTHICSATDRLAEGPASWCWACSRA